MPGRHALAGPCWRAYRSTSPRSSMLRHASSRAAEQRSATSFGSSPSVTGLPSGRSVRRGRWRASPTPNRFKGAAAACAEVARDAVIDADLSGPPAAGPVWVGGFSFASSGGVDPQWASLPPTLLVLPDALDRAAGKPRGRHGECDLPGGRRHRRDGSHCHRPARGARRRARSRSPTHTRGTASR